MHTFLKLYLITVISRVLSYFRLYIILGHPILHKNAFFSLLKNLLTQIGKRYRKCWRNHRKLVLFCRLRHDTVRNCCYSFKTIVSVVLMVVEIHVCIRHFWLYRPHKSDEPSIHHSSTRSGFALQLILAKCGFVKTTTNSLYCEVWVVYFLNKFSCCHWYCVRDPRYHCRLLNIRLSAIPIIYM